MIGSTKSFRKFGVDLIGGIEWGTHLCQFYESKQDLIDILVPYFTEGLKSNEYCMWVTSPPLEVAEAKEALKKAVPNLEDYLRQGKIEIISYKDWYLLGGKFDCNRVLQGWVDKENAALERGLDGLRLTGNTFWIEGDLWGSFVDYEAAVNAVIGKHKMIALCTYCLLNCTGTDVVDVVRNHVGTLIKQDEKWVLVENAIQRKNAEEELRKSEGQYSSLFANMSSGFAYCKMIYDKQGKPEDFIYLKINDMFEKITGLKRELVVGRKVTEAIPGIKKATPELFTTYGRVAKTGNPEKFEINFKPLNMWLSVSVYSPEQGYFAAVFEDITERKKAEESTRRTEALHVASKYARSLIEASLDPLVTISADGKITDVNKATEIVTGHSRDKLVGSNFSAYFTEPEKADAGYRKVFSNGFVRDYPLAIEHKSGRITYVLYNASLYRNEKGEIQGVFAAARDITDRKQAEDQLRQASLYSRSLIEASLDPLVTISASGKITDVNKATEEVTGCARSELIGSDFSDYFTEPIKARDGYKKVFTEGLVRDYPLAIRHRSGRITDVLYNASVYRDEAGDIQGIFAAARDVTERKVAEEKLRSASLYARSLIEASLDPLVTISADGKITDVNIATEDVTGYSREQLIGSDFSDYFTEPEKAREGYKQVFTEGFVKDYPLAIRHQFGKVTDVLYNATVYTNARGEVQGIFAAARDVTERNIIERELKQTLEKLKQSNAELEQFAYVASHDLQEPLRMVASYVQLLERRYKGKLDSDADEFIGYAVDGVNRMRGLIDDLLTYSRVSRLGKPFEPTDLNSTLQIVLSNLKASIADTGATVTHDKLPEVEVDSGQMVQLFQNLIGNAIKFHGKEPPRVHVAVKSQGAEYLFSVKDNGIGIDPQYYDRLFRIFQRLHTKQEYPGSGIGLVICKRIVERHGGRIWLKSELGKGSIVYFTLKKKQKG